jgi:tyrosyl-tRNA synthetase
MEKSTGNEFIASLGRQMEIIARGAEEILPFEELKAKVKKSIEKMVPLRVKLGLDPSAPDIHLGHTVVLRKLRQFQDLGHIAVLIVGNFTGMIGDPTNKSETRKKLSKEEVKANAATYIEQVCRILDKDKTEVVYNADWLSGMTMDEILRLTSCFTVARMLERDDFAKRYSKGIPISLVEFIYPLFQGIDSVYVKSDVELGGTDQKFNLLVGRELQKEYGQNSQVIITMPLIEGTDGVQKMSKSLGNYIGITDPPYDKGVIPGMYGKVMSIPDELMIKYFKLLTDVDVDEIEKTEKGLKDEKLHPADVKRRLAFEIVKLYHSEREAKEAADRFNLIHKKSEKLVVDDSLLEELVIFKDSLKDGKLWIVNLIKLSGSTKTNGEAKRLIEQGAVKLGSDLIKDVSLDLEPENFNDKVLMVGKRRIFKLIFK